MPGYLLFSTCALKSRHVFIIFFHFAPLSNSSPITFFNLVLNLQEAKQIIVSLYFVFLQQCYKKHTYNDDNTLSEEKTASFLLTSAGRDEHHSFQRDARTDHQFLALLCDGTMSGKNFTFDASELSSDEAEEQPPVCELCRGVSVCCLFVCLQCSKSWTRFLFAYVEQFRVKNFSITSGALLYPWR